MSSKDRQPFSNRELELKIAAALTAVRRSVARLEKAVDQYRQHNQELLAAYQSGNLHSSVKNVAPFAQSDPAPTPAAEVRPGGTRGSR